MKRRTFFRHTALAAGAAFLPAARALAEPAARIKIGQIGTGHAHATGKMEAIRRLSEIYELAGIRTSSHSGRRTFATRLNAKGVGMKTIQKLLGHRHIGTTALYCDVSEDTLRNAVELV